MSKFPAGFCAAIDPLSTRLHRGRQSGSLDQGIGAGVRTDVHLILDCHSRITHKVIASNKRRMRHHKAIDQDVRCLTAPAYIAGAIHQVVQQQGQGEPECVQPA